MCSGVQSCKCCNVWPVLLEDYGIKIKCMYPTQYKAPVAYSCPKWYVMQILAKMVVLGCRKLLLCFYSNLTMVVIECEFDGALWGKIWREVKSYLDKPRPQLLQRIKDITGNLGDELEIYSKTCCTVVGKFPSVAASTGSPKIIVDRRLPFNPYFSGSACSSMHRQSNMSGSADSDLSTIIEAMRDNCLEGINYLRNEATDIIAFVVADIQRLHRPGIPPHIPVAYAMKSASLTTNIMRLMLADVREACHKHNARIMCEITDGEFLKIANSTVEGQPLTLLQHLKWRYKFFQQKSKEQLLHTIMLRINPPYNYKWYFVTTQNARDILATFYRRSYEKEKKKRKSTCNSIVNLNEDKQMELMEGTKLSHKIRAYYAGIARNSTDGTLGEHHEVQSRTTMSDTHHAIEDALPQNNCVNENTIISINFEDDSDTEDVTYVPSDSESSSDEDVGAKIGDDEENYDVDFPGKPDNFDRGHLADVHPCVKSILDKLQRSHYQVKWNAVTVNSLVDDFLSTAHKLWKLKHPELNIIQNEIYKFFGKKIFNVTAVKSQKIIQLTALFCPWLKETEEQDYGCSQSIHTTNRTVTSLSDVAKKFILSSKYPKDFLQIVVCQMTNYEDLNEWLNASPISPVIDIPEARINHRIFCYPVYNDTTEELECRSLDPSHILNNLRSQICRHGFKGVSTEAFHAVSKVNSKLISKIMLADQMDKQKVSVSKEFFSKEVEKILLNLGYTSEARFVQLVRNWYLACDERGIAPLTRLKYLEEMQYHLRS